MHVVKNIKSAISLLFISIDCEFMFFLHLQILGGKKVQFLIIYNYLTHFCC